MIVFRTMTEEDIPRVAQLEQMIFTDPWSEKVYRETLALESVESVVAVDEAEDEKGLIVAAAGVRNISGTGEITNVMVLPAYRRRGIARKMLEDLLARGRKLGATDYTLEVRKSNKGAIKLYESLGFESAGIRPRFYRNPEEDAVIYWLKESDDLMYTK